MESRFLPVSGCNPVNEGQLTMLNACMNILRLYPFLPPGGGGMEKHIACLTREQRQQGCNVTIIYNQGAATGPYDFQVLPWLDLRKVRPQLLRDFIFFSAVFCFLLVKRLRVDVVHVHGDWSAFLFAKLATLVVAPSRLVASVHGALRRSKYWPAVYRFSLNNYHAVYATGADDADFLSPILRCIVRHQSSGIEGIFVDGARKGEREYNFDVVVVANFFPVKNHGLVVDIAKLLPGVRFLLIGDGPQRSLIEGQCRGAGVDNVTFSGKLCPADIATKLQNTKIFLSTSFSEGTPTAMLEAMAAGLTVVTSRSNDYSPIISGGVNGYVIGSFVASEYAGVISRLVDDPDFLSRARDMNKTIASRYVWSNVARNITALMRD